ncbi:MAG: hypothetical protein M1834_006566 [Cirrosporium novae-zelandiae]|nr:MAG: hypothetical protein M1834_006566 [Cirrosporium novae-zelandiae]
MPYFPEQTLAVRLRESSPSPPTMMSPPPDRIRIKNRRKRYLDLHPEYFSSSLELADPLLYDRLVRRFQTTSEREAEGRAKGYSGVLEADLMRSEAKLEALANPDKNATFTYKRGPNGEIMAEQEDEIPPNKEEGMKRWRWEMEMRFIRGGDEDFDYEKIDNNEDFDDHAEEERQKQEDYFSQQEPEWVFEDGEEDKEKQPQGETGIQDF